LPEDHCFFVREKNQVSQTCYFELPKPEQTISSPELKMTFDEMSAAQVTDNASFSEYLENMSESSYDVVQLTTIGAVSGQAQNNYSYVFEEFKTAD